jgi:hypothetical protein
MRLIMRWFVISLLGAMLVNATHAKGPAYTDPNKTDADFAFQGEYVGSIKTGDGSAISMQVIALVRYRNIWIVETK